jgi:hypothetical protein
MANECGVGSADLTYAGMAINFLASDGVDESGAIGGAVEDTQTGSATATYCPFDVTDSGEVTGTGICDHTVDVAALVNGVAQLTITYVITNAGNTTAATRIGDAILISAPTNSAQNVKNVYNFTWKWSAKPTFSPEAA